ncbi:MAG: hypothetical protein IJ507_08385 [Clostridia bacterium]|nr:hypothetical protein [Clostridia bacterium]
MNFDINSMMEAIKQQDTAALLAYFSNGQANLNLPSFGAVTSNRIFAMLVKKIAHRFGYLNVFCEPVSVVSNDKLMVAQMTLKYNFYDEERDNYIPYSIPTALVCELDAEGKISFMNVYTAFNYLVGKEIIRPAMYNADADLYAALPESVKAHYEQQAPRSRYELCRVNQVENCLVVEENALFTLGEICTPQAHVTVFEMDGDQVVKAAQYGEVVWDFKLWPTLY